MNVNRLIKTLKHVSRLPEVLTCVRETACWGWLVPVYLGLQKATFPREFKTRAGAALTLETFHDLVTTWIIFFRPEYEVDPNDLVIIDAGANIGAFSIYAAGKAPRARVFALEPFPSTWSRLLRHIEVNRLSQRITVLPLALGGEEGQRIMDDQSAASQSRGVFAANTQETGTAVQATTLESFLNSHQLSHVDLLKMDIEGSEHEVLTNTSLEVLQRIDRFALEYHPNGPKSALFDKLIQAGFSLERDLPVHPDSGVAHFARRRR